MIIVIYVITAFTIGGILGFLLGKVLTEMEIEAKEAEKN